MGSALRYSTGNQKPVMGARAVQRALTVVPIVSGCAFLLMFIVRSGWHPDGAVHFTLFDDAMISMTYARTLAESGELVWYPGAPRVLGVTNPLWTLLMAALHAVGLQNSVAALAVAFLSGVLVFCCGVVVWRLVGIGAVPDYRRSVFQAWALGMSLLMYPLVFWALRGFEVGALALCVVGGFLAVIRMQDATLQRPSAGYLALVLGVTNTIGVWLRLDYLPLAIALVLMAVFWADSRATRWRIILLGLAPAVVGVVVLVIVQYLYFGDWLPNTYYLKVEGVSIGDRLTRGVLSAAKAGPLLAVIITSYVVTRIVGTSRVARRINEGAIVVFVVALGYSVWTGGDAWEGYTMLNRQVSVVLPVVAAAVFTAAAYLYKFRPGAADVESTATDQRWKQPQLAWIYLLLVAVSGMGFGVMVNPASFSWPRAAIGLASMSIVSFGFWYRLRKDLFTKRQTLAPIVIACMALLVATSAVAGPRWLLRGAQDADTDYQMTKLGQELARVTQPGAKVAVLFAGAPVYYSRRDGVDLLGKSDPVIARGPRGQAPPGSALATFFPGHDKFNTRHSVGDLRPDLIVQIWPFEVAEPQFTTWGYSARCLPDGQQVWVLASTPRVDSVQVQLC